MIDFAGKVAIVTGAGKGLGRQHAEALAARGAAVLVNNRRSDGEATSSADDVAAAIRSSGGLAIADHEPVDCFGSGRRIVDAALDAFGRVDIVIANAGVSMPTAFHKEPMEQVRAVVDVNLFGAIDVVHEALPYMRAQRSGKVIVTTSSAALFGDIGFVSYATAKAALVGFAASLALESRNAGITVNAVLPFANTPMTKQLFAKGAFASAAAGAMSAAPVTNLVLWLVSDGCEESGHVWVSAGRVVCKAVMNISPGIIVDDTSPEALAARAGDIGAIDSGNGSSYSSGAEMLEAMIRATLGTI